MTDAERGLLAAVCADPADDTARLVYADWLDEYGGRPEQADKLRLQVELARFGEPKPGCWCGAKSCRVCQVINPLRERQQQLLADPRNYVNWTPLLMHSGSRAGIRYETGGIVGLFGNGFQQVEFVRGFIGAITCSAVAWLNHADALYWRPEQDRPCPETAQPLTRVVLTTLPEIATHIVDGVPYPVVGGDWTHDSQPRLFRYWDHLTNLLALKWPGIMFELRHESYPDIPIGLTSAETLREMYGLPSLAEPD